MTGVSSRAILPLKGRWGSPLSTAVAVDDPYQLVVGAFLCPGKKGER